MPKQLSTFPLSGKISLLYLVYCTLFGYVQSSAFNVFFK